MILCRKPSKDVILRLEIIMEFIGNGGNITEG